MKKIQIRAEREHSFNRAKPWHSRWNASIVGQPRCYGATLEDAVRAAVREYRRARFVRKQAAKAEELAQIVYK